MNCKKCGDPRQIHKDGIHCQDGTSIYTINLIARLTVIEAHEISSALRRTGGNVKAAAEALTMPRRTLINKIAAHSIDVARYRDR
jgi:DNA-binding NtrC family response regulator